MYVCKLLKCLKFPQYINIVRVSTNFEDVNIPEEKL